MVICVKKFFKKLEYNGTISPKNAFKLGMKNNMASKVTNYMINMQKLKKLIDML